MYNLLPLLAIFIWAGNGLVNKMSFGVIDPTVIAFYRWLFAILILSPFLLRPAWRQRQELRRQLPKLIVLSLLGMVMCQSLQYFAAATTTAIHMALIFSLVPVVGLLLAVPLLGQSLSKWALLGGCIALAGLVVMLAQGDIPGLFAAGLNQGDIYMLAATLAYALYNVLIKRWEMPAVSSWVSVYMQGIIATLLLLPTYLIAPDISISSDAWPLVMYATIAASIVAPWAWVKGIGLLGADHSAMYMNLLPVLQAFAAHQFLKEPLTFYHYIGGGMVLVGVVCSRVRASRILQEEKELVFD